MATLTRPYLIRRRDGTGTPRMVEASSQAAALRHVAVDTYTVEVPSALEAVRLMQTGVDLEAVKADLPETGDLFGQAHGDPEEADSEGGETDVDREARTAGLSDVERERYDEMTAHANASKRTARGRAATKAALEAGQT